jgi:hypothetical protein
MTGPNRSADRERKAYIVQFAPDGAELVAADARRTRCEAPGRQYPVLEGGGAPG